MEQAKRKRAHLGRVLLVCGNQNAGKSRLMRNMLGDERLGGTVPVSGPVRLRALSRERALAVRFSSPHEKNQSQIDFHKMIDRFTERAWRSFWRVDFACAVQPRPFNKMPGIVDVCEGLIRDFIPERIRVVQLAPDQWGGDHSCLTAAEVDALRSLDVEVLSIDARRNPAHPAEPGNVRILADFFDFS